MRQNMLGLFLMAGVVVFASPSIFASSKDNSLTFQVIQSQFTFNRSNVESATVLKQGDAYAVQIKLKPTVLDEFNRITKNGIGKMANMIFNGKVISTTTIQSELGGDFMVTGFSKNDAVKYANSIKKQA